MSDPLVCVREAAEARKRAEAAYRAAILKAREEHTLEAIAQAAGVTKQAVHKQLRHGVRAVELRNP